LSQCNSERTWPVFKRPAWISTLVFEIEILQAERRAEAARSDKRRISLPKKRNRRRYRKHRTISINSRARVDLLKLEKHRVRIVRLKNATALGAVTYTSTKDSLRTIGTKHLHRGLQRKKKTK
jgi:hypothetical protein